MGFAGFHQNKVFCQCFKQPENVSGTSAAKKLLSTLTDFCDSHSNFTVLWTACWLLQYDSLDFRSSLKFTLHCVCSVASSKIILVLACKVLNGKIAQLHAKMSVSNKGSRKKIPRYKKSSSPLQAEVSARTSLENASWKAFSVYWQNICLKSASLLTYEWGPLLNFVHPWPEFWVRMHVDSTSVWSVGWLDYVSDVDNCSK